VVADLSAGGGEEVERTERKLQREREREREREGGMRTESDVRFGRSFLIFRRRDRLSVTFLRCTIYLSFNSCPPKLCEYVKKIHLLVVPIINFKLFKTDQKQRSHLIWLR
jgi:hypothetical protein